MMAKRRSIEKPEVSTEAIPEQSADESSSMDRGLFLSTSGLPLPSKLRPFVVEYFPTPEQFAAERQVRAMELDSQQKRATKALRSVKKEWQAKLNETGQKAAFNVAYRTKFGQVVAPLQYVIRIDVSQKLNRDSLRLRGDYVFPVEVDGIPTKVRQIVVDYKPGTGAAPATTSIVGGVGISSSGNPGEYGTLGICVDVPGQGTIGLTNWHVVKRDVDDTSAAKIYPRGTTQASAFGQSVRSVINRFIDAARVDPLPNSAMAEGLSGEPTSATSFRFLKNTHLRRTSKIDGWRVFKIGAASFRTEAVVTNSSTEQYISGLGQFENLIEVNNDSASFILGGDSGSVLACDYMESGVSVVLILGLNFAGSSDGRTGYAIPFGKVASELGILASLMPSQLVEF